MQQHYPYNQNRDILYISYCEEERTWVVLTIEEARDRKIDLTEFKEYVLNE